MVAAGDEVVADILGDSVHMGFDHREVVLDSNRRVLCSRIHQEEDR